MKCRAALTVAMVVLAWLVVPPSTHAAPCNLLVNPGFETGDFTGWTVGGAALKGVALDGTALPFTIFSDNEVNVQSGLYAAWARLRTFPDEPVVLSQTVHMVANTAYDIGFGTGLGTDEGNAGRSAEVVVGGITLFSGNITGPNGKTPADYVVKTLSYVSGPTSGPVTLTFTLRGSGSGYAGFSFDDFFVIPATNLFDNGGFENGDFSGWTVGGSAVSGVGQDGDPISGTIFTDNQVNVQNGDYAAWAKLRTSVDTPLILSQTVTVLPNTNYEIAFATGLGTTEGNAGRSAVIKVAGVEVFNDNITGPNGTGPADFVTKTVSYASGASGGPVVVEFTLRGSGSGFAGFSFDDFNMAVAVGPGGGPLLSNPGFETGDFSSWTVGGSATSGVGMDADPISGTLFTDNQVNVQTGTYAAWAKLRTFPDEPIVLSQTVNVTSNTIYSVGFGMGLGTTEGNAGRSAIIDVGGVEIFNDFVTGPNGTGPGDYVTTLAAYSSGATSGPVTVTYTIRGSGSGHAGFSFDDFVFEEAPTALVNPGFETGDFSGWTVGGTATAGVGTDGDPISGTIFTDNQVNVRTGTYAAWGKLRTFPDEPLVLSQSIAVEANQTYRVGFSMGLGTTEGNAGRSAVIEVGGTEVFNDNVVGPNGLDPSDYVTTEVTYDSGPASEIVTVTFTLRGSGSGYAGFSFDDFVFEPAGNLISNAGFETCDFAGWTVGGLATAGVGMDGDPISGTIFTDNEVNVQTGTCAAWAKLRTFPDEPLTLSQTVQVEPNTVYDVGFSMGLGTTEGNAGRSAVIDIGGQTAFDAQITGPNGTGPGDFVTTRVHYSSGATSGPVTVTFTLRGSGSAHAGFSFDDFFFTVNEDECVTGQVVAVGDPPPLGELAFVGAAFPNPARLATTIPFQFGGRGAQHVSLKVYDIKGALVRTLVDGSRAPGPHTAYWGGINEAGVRVAPGAYFVRLRVAGESVSRKLVMLR